jgi:hypothetical protein
MGIKFINVLGEMVILLKILVYNLIIIIVLMKMLILILFLKMKILILVN